MGVNVNGLMFNGGYNRKNMFSLKLNYRQFLVSFLNHILTRSNAHVLFVPHTFAPPESVESDPAACACIIDELDLKFRDRIHLVTLPHNQNEIKWVIGKCDFFVGSRMHACIAALSQGIPAVGVAYSKKFKGVFESVGAAEWVLDGRVLSADEAVAAAVNFFEKRAEMSERLTRTVPEAQKLVYKVFQEVLTSAEPEVESSEKPIDSLDALSAPKTVPTNVL